MRRDARPSSRRRKRAGWLVNVGCQVRGSIGGFDMLRFKKIRVLSSLGSEPLGSPGWLAVPTVLVFGLALMLSWARPLRGQGPGPCSGGPNYCLWNANNACSYLTYKTCAPTGPGYTCWIQGKQYTEGYFSMSVSKTWPRCSTPATLSTMSCTQAPPSVGPCCTARRATRTARSTMPALTRPSGIGRIARRRLAQIPADQVPRGIV